MSNSKKNKITPFVKSFPRTNKKMISQWDAMILDNDLVSLNINKGISILTYFGRTLNSAEPMRSSNGKLDKTFKAVSGIVAQVVLGEFYTDERSIEGIVGEVIFGMIPIVGQVQDLRDTIASGYKVMENPGDISNWKEFGFTLFYWIPLTDILKVRKFGKLKEIKQNSKRIEYTENPMQSIKIGSKGWRKSFSFKGNQEGVVYILRDSKGEILKVGKSQIHSLKGRLSKYLTCANKLGVQLNTDVFTVDKNNLRTIESIEKGMRKHIERDFSSHLPWDNTNQRLGRKGSGLPIKCK